MMAVIGLLALVGNLLRLANSVFHRLSAEPVDRIQRARAAGALAPRLAEAAWERLSRSA